MVILSDFTGAEADNHAVKGIAASLMRFTSLPSSGNTMSLPGGLQPSALVPEAGRAQKTYISDTDFLLRCREM